MKKFESNAQRFETVCFSIKKNQRAAQTTFVKFVAAFCSLLLV